MSELKRPHIPQIDALRALAVVAVLAFHMDPSWLPGGFSGVDVFFVISGYVVSASMTDLESLKPSRFLSTFYARRIIRILPALVVCLGVTALMAGMIIPKSWLSNSNQSTLTWAFAGLSNYALMLSGDEYFSQRIEFNPAAHTWSLGVEEQFYLILPALYCVFLRLQRPETRQRALVCCVLAMSLLSLAYSAWVSGSGAAQAYYSIASRWWELGCGVLLFQAHRHGRHLCNHPRWSALQATVALLLLALGLVLSDKAHFPFPWAMLTVGGTALLIDAIVSPASKAQTWMDVLRHGAFVTVGKLSYSLYLWHWPVYVAFRWTVGLETPVQRALALSATVGLSWLSYRFVENPLRRHPALPGLPRYQIIVAGLIVVLLGIVFAKGVYKIQDPLLSLSVTRDAKDWYPDAWYANNEELPGCQVSRSSIGKLSGSRTDFLAQGCPSQHGSQRLFVLGDSHARVYETMLSRLAKEHGIQVTLFFYQGCPTLSLIKAQSSFNQACRDFQALAMDEALQEMKPGDLVFLPSLRLIKLGDQNGLKPAAEIEAFISGPQASSERRIALDEAQTAIQKILAKGANVVFAAPTPLFPSPPFRCSDWFNKHNPICAQGMTTDRAFMERLRSPVMQALDELARTSAPGRVRVWDPLPTLCPATTCEVHVNGRPLFFDGDHLSGHANEVLYPGFEQTIQATSTTQPSDGKPDVEAAPSTHH